MPVILGIDDWTDWLDPAADVEDLKLLLGRPDEVPLALQPVSTRVKDVRNNDPSLVEDLE